MESDSLLIEEIEETKISPVEISENKLDISTASEIPSALCEKHDALPMEEIFPSDSVPETASSESKNQNTEYETNIAEDLKSKESNNLSLNTSESINCNVDEFDNSPFSINSPPSPVYPPKSLKLQDFQSLKTKMDKLPLHKKKQIHIPSPSSPVEEVRKKFEQRVSSSNKVTDSPITEMKSRPQLRDLTPKLVRTFEVSEPAEVAASQQSTKPIVTTEPSRRHSEPPPKMTDAVSSSEIVKRISNKYESESSKCNKATPEKQTAKPKPLQPSLFTQLKIRKLQSLKADSGNAPEPVDPWSDPILDMQEDYHPIAAFLLSPTSERDTADVSLESDVSVKQSESEKSILKQIECENDVTEKQIKHDVEPLPSVFKLTKRNNSIESVSNQSSVQIQEDKSEIVSSEVENSPSGSKLNETPESEAVKKRTN
ncbi:uncharacterized protein CEXT_453921 [Caerostris extrusa]|uniref:Uncharacterized protein n=1 Tax=Caerostris extrusa TaxID=172846 RepID=A0AAV4MBF0_CAEEX|nr:uncharacterized protein CEXT_453921 [Caerostris extrusa]